MARDAHRLQTLSIDTTRGSLGCLDAHPHRPYRPVLTS